MNYTTFDGYQISQLTLGTVQFGINYGISNDSGKPEQEKCLEMIASALNLGINTLDTARQYGNSEEVLGAFIAKNSTGVKPNLVSKFKISPANLGYRERAWKEILESVRTSLHTLRISELPVCLLHKGMEPIEEVMTILPEMIRRLKEEGLISIGGISAYFPEDVRWFLDIEEIAATQIPVNIFDQRLIKSGLMDRLAAANKLVFVRSVFLQGLFFMEQAHLKGNLKPAQKHLKILKELASQAEMSVAQLAFSFVRDLSGVNSIVFGAVNEEQIRENISLLMGCRIPVGIADRLTSIFNDVEEDLLSPGAWKVG